MARLSELIDRFTDAMKRAQDAGFELSNGFALATSTRAGRPSVRIVLLKGVDERGFVFYTNLESRKARELDENSFASACFWWPQLQEQVRVEGAIEPVSGEEADAYFASRPRGSQLGAWASQQSRPLDSREELIGRFVERMTKWKDQSVPRPPYWSGYRLVPQRIEFWYNRDDRLHDRHMFERTGDDWKETILQP